MPMSVVLFAYRCSQHPSDALCKACVEIRRIEEEERRKAALLVGARAYMAVRAPRGRSQPAPSAWREGTRTAAGGHGFILPRCAGTHLTRGHG